MTLATKLLECAKFLFITFLMAFATVLGCGTLPQGDVSAMSFNVSGFTLASEMAYSEAPTVHTLVPSLSKSKEAAYKVIRDLIMSGVNDVLQEQGRNALLPDAVISLILQQLNVTIEYTPLDCKTATDSPTNLPNMPADIDGCFVIDGMVRTLCAIKATCNLMTGMHLKPIPSQYYSLSGNLRTSNVIMANWSRQMWQSVLNRVHRSLATGRFGPFFSTAVVTVK